MRTTKRKYVVVLGSLMSGLGKGIVASSIARILQSKGLRVVPIKFDGYLNVDCGTMNPYRHGEVYVLDDGTECDMDFGTYERFLNIDLRGINSITGGKLFRHIIEKERAGGFLGYDVQIVPHLTNEIKAWVRKVGDEYDADVVIIEVGGTVGDLENGYFIEAMRQLGIEERDVIYIQLTYVPSLSSGEQKTKPTQHATRLLTSMGIQPSIILCREHEPLTKDAREKIAIYCNVQKDAVFDDPHVETIYEIPGELESQKFSDVMLRELGLKGKDDDFVEWRKLVKKIKEPKKSVTIGITGKYTAVKDAYVSIKEALIHAGASLDCGVKVKWIETSEMDDGKTGLDALKDCNGILVPGGFGARGVEGKIACVKYAREKKIPYLGLCFGMQLAVVEFARNACGLGGAHTTEIDEKAAHPVVDLLPEQKGVKDKGATMRLGGHDVEVKKGTIANKIYKSEKVRERFRHRYEVNPEYIERLEKGGLVFSGKAPGKNIMQICELPEHPFFLATQFHPEFTSHFERPNPLFKAFVEAAAEKK